MKEGHFLDVLTEGCNFKWVILTRSGFSEKGNECLSEPEMKLEA